MKTIKILLLICTMCCNAALAQERIITIQGKVKNVPDGGVIMLMQGFGNAFSSVANDTILNGEFSFEYAVDNSAEMPKLFEINGGLSPDIFEPRAYQIFWAPEGITTIKGGGADIKKWSIENSDETQKENSDLLAIQLKYADRIQPIELLIDSCRRCSPLPPEHDSLNKERNEIFDMIYAEQIKYLHTKKKLTQSGVKELQSIALFGLKINKGMEPYREQIREIYNTLSPEQQASADGAAIAAILDPRRTMNIGDRLPNNTLKDTTGTNHTMREYLGKYILIDVWSMGCGPCIAAGDELREIHEKYKEQLTVVGINVDADQGWKTASKRYNITWTNLSDGMGLYAGFCSNFKMNGIPHYVLANDKGVIVDIWNGYGKGSLLEKLTQHIK